MTLVSRMSRLFKADVHGMLDWLEEPESVLKQAVRDMEEELAKEKTALEEIQKGKKRFAERKTEAQEYCAEVGKQIALCFETGNDEMAKALIRKQLEAENREKVMEKKIAALDGEETELKEKINAHENKLEAVLEKMRLFSSSKQSVEESDVFDLVEGSGGFSGVSDEDVEIAFIKEKKKYCGESAA